MNMRFKRLLACLLIAMMTLGDIIAVAETAASIELPASIKTIEAEAFCGDTSIGKVIVPYGTKEIGSRAFADSSLTEIELPESLTFIAEDAFEGCGEFLALAPSGSLAYQYCADKGIRVQSFDASPASDFLYGYSGGGITLYAYSGTDTTVVIPNIIGEYPVTCIDGAFYDCRRLTRIVIPNSVTKFDNYAFRNCSSLTDIKIPKNVTSIGKGSFLGCSSLTSIAIPNCVTNIGESAFGNCSSLKHITIPDSVTSIGGGAFLGCSSLTDIVLPEGISSIDMSTFSACSGLTHITIPDSVTSIGHSAFSGCSSLTSISIPDYVTSVESGLFSGCSKLKSIVLPEGISSIGSSAFEDCSDLEYITLPGSVVEIGMSAFNGCSSLKEITIPEGVTDIADYAFGDCSSLEHITIPNSVTSIGELAFWNCSSLTSVTIPASVTSIEFGAFFKCSSLTSITIPKSVTSIGDDAFGFGSGNLTIYGESGSYAEAYAAKNNLSFSAVSLPELLNSGRAYEWPVSSIGASKDFALFVGSDWTATQIPEWVTLSAESGSNGDVITISAEENTGLDRTGIIRFESSTQSVSFVIVQNGGLRIDIGGRVCLEDGSGLSGVQVAVYHSETVLAAETVTDEDGCWQISGILPHKTYTVYYKHDSYAAAPTTCFASEKSVSIEDVVAAESAGSEISFVSPIASSEVAANTELYLNWTAVEGAAYYRYSARYVEDEEAFVFRRMTNSTEAWIPVTQMESGRELQLWAAAFGESDDDILSQQIIRVTVASADAGDSAGHEHVYGDAYCEEGTWYRACSCGDTVTIVRNEYEAEIKADAEAVLCPHGTSSSFCCICHGSHNWGAAADILEADSHTCERCALTIENSSTEQLYFDALNSVPEGCNPIDDTLVVYVLIDRFTKVISHARAMKIMSALRRAPQNARDVYLYSVFEYEFEAVTDKMQYHPSSQTIRVKESAYTNDDEFLSVWFHEAGHAVDHNYNGEDTLGHYSLAVAGAAHPVLYERLYADCYSRSAVELMAVEAESGIILTGEEKELILEKTLDPFLSKDFAENEDPEDILYSATGNLKWKLMDFVKNHMAFSGAKVRDEEQDLNEEQNQDEDPHLENSHMASDIWGGMTNNYIFFYWYMTGGHGVPYGSAEDSWSKDAKPYYWFNKDHTPTYAQCREAFAEYYSAIMIGNAQIIGFNADSFPMATEYMNGMVTILMNVYNRRHP